MPNRRSTRQRGACGRRRWMGERMTLHQRRVVLDGWVIRHVDERRPAPTAWMDAPRIDEVAAAGAREAKLFKDCLDISSTTGSNATAGAWLSRTSVCAPAAASRQCPAMSARCLRSCRWNICSRSKRATHTALPVRAKLTATSQRLSPITCTRHRN